MAFEKALYFRVRGRRKEFGETPECERHDPGPGSMTPRIDCNVCRPPQARGRSSGGIQRRMYRIRTFATLLAALFVATPALAAGPNIVAHLAASQALTSGPCPADINFKGAIKTDNWSPTALRRIQYRFIRSDGAVAPIHSISFPVSGGSYLVTTTWTLGAAYRGWEGIQILYPRNVESNKASFRLVCGAKQ